MISPCIRLPVVTLIKITLQILKRLPNNDLKEIVKDSTRFPIVKEIQLGYEMQTPRPILIIMVCDRAPQKVAILRTNFVDHYVTALQHPLVVATLYRILAFPMRTIRAA